MTELKHYAPSSKRIRVQALPAHNDGDMILVLKDGRIYRVKITITLEGITNKKGKQQNDDRRT